MLESESSALPLGDTPKDSGSQRWWLCDGIRTCVTGNLRYEVLCSNQPGYVAIFYCFNESRFSEYGWGTRIPNRGMPRIKTRCLTAWRYPPENTKAYHTSFSTQLEDGCGVPSSNLGMPRDQNLVHLRSWRHPIRKYNETKQRECHENGCGRQELELCALP